MDHFVRNSSARPAKHTKYSKQNFQPKVSSLAGYCCSASLILFTLLTNKPIPYTYTPTYLLLAYTNTIVLLYTQTTTTTN